jgi:hypothetical protein
MSLKPKNLNTLPRKVDQREVKDYFMKNQTPFLNNNIQRPNNGGYLSYAKSVQEILSDGYKGLKFSSDSIFTTHDYYIFRPL